MTMNLTPGQLSEVVDKVIDLDRVGVEVKVIEIHEHDIYLRREGKEHRIVGITNKRQPGGNLREAR